MSRKLFVNLPVKDLKKSVAFFTELGFVFNPAFTDETATCMVLNEGAYVMLLVESKFKEFTSKSIIDTAGNVEVITSFSVDSRQAVDELVTKALALGSKPAKDPLDLGFMYNRSFLDPDGHIWEAFWMDPNAIPQ
ncbi:VOC family protein [Pendulispora albinea]|uniref:Glyoxalase n=1 Tax=Pendulispora albinea TaxID=2741071 RepID=A0ABZ2M3C9_9BACT